MGLLVISLVGIPLVFMYRREKDQQIKEKNTIRAIVYKLDTFNEEINTRAHIIQNLASKIFRIFLF